MSCHHSSRDVLHLEGDSFDNPDTNCSNDVAKLPEICAISDVISIGWNFMYYLQHGGIHAIDPSMEN